MSKLHKLQQRKADAIAARAEYVRMGMGPAVQQCNAIIADCSRKLAKLEQATAKQVASDYRTLAQAFRAMALADIQAKA